MIDPRVTKQQRVTVLLNGTGTNTLAYSFAAPGGNGNRRFPPSTPIRCWSMWPGVAAGVYLVRVSVDGAESALGMSSSGTYNAPTVIL